MWYSGRLVGSLMTLPGKLHSITGNDALEKILSGEHKGKGNCVKGPGDVSIKAMPGNCCGEGNLFRNLEVILWKRWLFWVSSDWEGNRERIWTLKMYLIWIGCEMSP